MTRFQRQRVLFTCLLTAMSLAGCLAASAFAGVEQHGRLLPQISSANSPRHGAATVPGRPKSKSAPVLSSATADDDDDSYPRKSACDFSSAAPGELPRSVEASTPFLRRPLWPTLVTQRIRLQI